MCRALLHLAAHSICLITLIYFDVLASRNTLLISLLFFLCYTRVQLVHLTNEFLNLGEIAGSHRLVLLSELPLFDILTGGGLAIWAFK